MPHRIRRTPPSTLVIVTAAALLAFPMVARADEHDVARRDTRDGYAYSFTDDGLTGGFLDAQGGRIHAIRHAERDVLIRPRLSFVPELLKSVEDL